MFRPSDEETAAIAKELSAFLTSIDGVEQTKFELFHPHR